MAGRIADLLVRIGADISDLQRALAQSQGDLESYKQSIEAGALSTTQLALAAVAAGAAILAFFRIAVLAAAESEKETRLLETALRAAGQAADVRPYQEQATALQTLTGVSDETILSIQRLFVNVGATREQILRLTPAVLDFAAATGQDARDAATGFSRALAGLPLRGLAKAFTNSIDLSKDFEGALSALERSTGGASKTLGETLPGSIARFRSALDDVLEVLGAPILAPITRLIGALANLAAAVAAFLKAHEPVVSVLTIAGVVLGVLLVGWGGYALLMPKIIALTNLLTTSLVGQKLAMVGLSAATMRHIAILALMRFGLIGIIATGAVVLGAMLLEIRRAQADFGKLGGGMQDTNTALQRHVGRVEKITERYQAAQAALKGLTAQEKLAAAAISLSKLEVPGLSAEQIQKVEAARENAFRQADEREKRRQIASTKTTLSELRVQLKAQQDRGEIAEDTANEVKKIETTLAEQTLDLQNSILKNEVDVAKARADAVKFLKDLRIRAETEAAQRTVELLQTQIGATQALESERTRVEVEGRQRRLATARLENDFRISALRRTLDIIKTLEEGVITAREVVLSAQGKRLEAQEIRAAAARARAVQDGLLTEEDAQKQADEARRIRDQQRLQAELDIQQRRLVLIEKTLARERAFAEQEAVMRLALLDTEMQAEIEAVKSRERLRELELRSAIELARAQTQARKAELSARLAAEIAMAQASAILAKSPEERRARLEALDQLLALQRQALEAQDAALIIQEKSLAGQLVLVQRGALDEIDAVQRQSALKRKQIEQELASAIVRLESDSLTERAQATDKLADLQLRAVQALTDEETKLAEQVRSGTITQAEADRRVKPLRDLASVIDRISKGELINVEKALGKLDEWTKARDDRIRLLQPLIDKIKSIGEAFAFPGGVPMVGLQPAAIAVAAGAGAVNNIFTFQGSTFRLTADESALMQRILLALAGPEFRKIIEDLLKRQPGSRT